MKVSRLTVDTKTASVKSIALKNTSCTFLLGDNRELMRHSDGALHAAIIEKVDGRPRMSLFGFKNPNDKFRKLAGPISSTRSRGDSQPATDSNQNGTYIAYVEAGERGKAGYIVHIPDPFGDPSHFKVHGPLTPVGESAQNSFLQASRGYNTIVYGWRNADAGEIYVGVSRDGKSFPEAKLVVQDKNIVSGPATGIFGDHALVVYQTSNPAFAPRSHKRNGHDECYYAYCESGDSGATWSKPAPLIPDIDDLPTAAAYSVSKAKDLRRSEVRLSGTADRGSSFQALMWVAPVSPDKRIFAMTSVTPSAANGGEDWQGKGNSVGVLAWKPFVVGGAWRYVLANRGLFRRTTAEKPYTGRIGSQYKYCALPESAVRVIAYVDKAPQRSKLEDQIAILVSTNMGDSFDYESTFTASQLGLEPDADIVMTNSACTHIDSKGNLWQDVLLGDLKRPDSVRHAMLPVGINVQGMDPTITW